MQIHSEYTDDPEDPTASEASMGFKRSLPVTACALHAGGTVLAKAQEAWVSKSANHMSKGHTLRMGKMRYNLPLPNLCPVPDSGQSSGIYPEEPSLRHEGSTNLLSATSRQAPQRYWLGHQCAPEQMPG